MALAGPFILEQILTNQIGYATSLATAAEDSATSVVNYFSTDFIPAQQSALSDLMSLDTFQTGFYSFFWSNPVLTPLLEAATPLLMAVPQVVEASLKNLEAAATAFFQSQIFAALGLIDPPGSLVNATGESWPT